MPPKKKGKKAGSALIDGVDTSSMTREQLEAFAHRLKNEMEREREERNFFQLERDKLRTFWEITRNQLEEAQAIIRNKDREIEEAKEVAEIDIKHVMQQMKHLEFENQLRIGEARAEAMTQLKLAQEDHAAQELELLNDKRELRQILREKEEAIKIQLQQLKMAHSSEINKIRREFETEVRELREWQDNRLNDYKYDTEIKHKMEMNEIVERKDAQIKKLIEDHDKALIEMKTYYNGITTNNLSLISSLKEQIEESIKNNQQIERKSKEISIENQKLVEPLKQTKSELIELQKKLKHYERDKIQLNRYKNRCILIEKKLNNQKWETEALIMCNDKLIEERNKLKDKFEETIIEFQQKTGLKNVLLKRRLEILQNEAEKREAILNEALIVTGTDPQQLCNQVDSLLQYKNELIQDLRFELIKICKMYNDLLQSYQNVLIENKISKNELSFEPLEIEDFHKIKFEKIRCITDTIET